MISASGTAAAMAWGSYSKVLLATGGIRDGVRRLRCQVKGWEVCRPRPFVSATIPTKAGAVSAWARQKQAAIDHWGGHKTTAVTLRDVCESGLDWKLRLQHGQFLHRELRIRISQRVLELQSLPCQLPEREGVREIIQWHTDFVMDLENAESPETRAKDEAFTSLLSQFFEEHGEVIKALAFSVRGLQEELGYEGYASVRPQVDAVLRRFFIARIGLRFLLQNHIESFRNRKGYSGILQLECSPGDIAKKAAKDSQDISRKHLGKTPPIDVIELPSNGTFTYVPMHLQYMLTEVFKNACRAVVEHHGESERDGTALPPIVCQIVHGYEDVTLKISDHGGGIARDRMNEIFKFMYSTYKKSPWSASEAMKDGSLAVYDSVTNPHERQHVGQGSVLAGYGVGLTLTRLYAQYWGGDLKIMSLDGYGTDVYLHLSRLGTQCESLPKVMALSPSARDSTPLDDDMATENVENLLLSESEEAFLKGELAAFRLGRRSAEGDDE